MRKYMFMCISYKYIYRRKANDLIELFGRKRWFRGLHDHFRKLSADEEDTALVKSRSLNVIL